MCMYMSISLASAGVANGSPLISATDNCVRRSSSGLDRVPMQGPVPAKTVTGEKGNLS